MPQFFNPPTVAKPSSSYSHGVLMSAGARRLVFSGQVGANAAGQIAEGLAAQTEQVFDNIFNVLAAAGMKRTDLIKIVVYVVAPADLAVMREVRARKLAGHAPASTLVMVAGLANPDYLIEIEGEAVQDA